MGTKSGTDQTAPLTFFKQHTPRLSLEDGLLYDLKENRNHEKGVKHKNCTISPAISQKDYSPLHTMMMNDNKPNTRLFLCARQAPTARLQRGLL